MLNNVAFKTYIRIWLAHVGFMFDAPPVMFMQSCTFMETNPILYIKTEYIRNMYEYIMLYSTVLTHRSSTMVFMPGTY